MRAWIRGAISLGLGLLLSEALVRGLYSTAVVRDAIVRHYGPDSMRLGFYYQPIRMAPSGAPVFGHDPEIGWNNLPGVREEAGSTVTVDERGLRATGARPTPRGSAPRVVALGDSFTFGSDGDDAWWWGAMLQREVPGLELADLAVPGYGLDQVLQQVRRDVPTWAPDAVLVGLNDLLCQRTMSPFQQAPKAIIPAETGALEPVGLPLPDQEEARRALRWTSHLGLTVGMLRWWRVSRDPAFNAIMGRRCAALLDAVARETIAGGATPVIVWFPMEGRVRAWVEGRPEPVMGGFTCPHGAVCEDLTDELAPILAGGQPFTAGTHWSQPTSALAAKHLAAILAPTLSPR